MYSNVEKEFVTFCFYFRESVGANFRNLTQQFSFTKLKSIVDGILEQTAIRTSLSPSDIEYHEIISIASFSRSNFSKYKLKLLSLFIRRF